jgi:transcription initiation factor TFIIIB Brf1 subunit/transcription initiation factor TFIIB
MQTSEISELDYEKWWTALDEERSGERSGGERSGVGGGGGSSACTEGQFAGCRCGATAEDILHEEMSICTKCGEVLGRLYDTTAEYRYFANDDRGGDPCRVGAPQDHRLPEASLGTMMLGGQGRNMYRIKKFQIWNAMPYKERSLLQIFDRLSLVATNYGLSSSILEETKEMYVTLHELCDRRGLTRDAVLASCLYTALKQAASPRKPKEIADMFTLSTATFTKALKFFQEVFALAEQKGLIKKVMVDTGYGSTKAEDYVSLPLSRLPIPRAKSAAIEAGARAVANMAEAEGYSVENVPPSLAAGCVAFVLSNMEDVHISMAEIAKAADVSVATLQKCLRRLEAYKEVLLGVAGFVAK